VLIDSERPGLTLSVTEGRLQAHVEELVSPDTLEILWRLKSSEGVTPWQPLGWELALEGMSGTVEVIARDISGNESLLQSVTLPAGEATHPKDPPSGESPWTLGGCAAAPGVVWGLLGLALPGIWRRRRLGRGLKRVG
jgi:MYXO-CTERM domain-containing protein